MMKTLKSVHDARARILQWGILFSFLSSLPNVSQAIPRSLSRQEAACALHLLENISPPGAARGAIVASPSSYEPNYRFHWVRDGALVSDVFVRIWWRSIKPTEREELFDHIKDILAFS